MNNLFLVKEMFTNGYLANILNIISLLAILCGILVIVSKNPVVSVLFLIGLFGNISGYLILIGLGFMGLAYLVVYVGAIKKGIVKLILHKVVALVQIQLYGELLIIIQIFQIVLSKVSSKVRFFQVVTPGKEFSTNVYGGGDDLSVIMY